MSARPEVDIQFGEVPLIRTANDLQEAAARLITCHYARVFDLEEECLGPLRSQFPGEEDLVLRALRQALITQAPDIRWDCGPPLKLSGPPEKDSGLHADKMVPGIISVGYHRTPPTGGGLEGTFATPIGSYDPDMNDDLMRLMRQNKTDPKLVDPDSFRRVVLEHGGIIGLTYVLPGMLPQLHDFLTLTDSRMSYVSILEGS